jgi:hypothetical protein
LVDVLPVDDDPPRIEVNEGMKASPSTYTPVFRATLTAVDDESPDVTFEVISPEDLAESSSIELNGRLFRTVEQKHSSDDNDSDEDDDDDRVDHYTAVTSFTQSDVNEGKILYRASTAATSNMMFLDRVWLRARDGAGNSSPRFALTVAVSPVDTAAPVLFPGATLQLTVDEYRVTEFGRDNMRFVGAMFTFQHLNRIPLGTFNTCQTISHY